MEESIAAIKWVFRGSLVAALLGAVVASYTFYAHPGRLAELVLGGGGGAARTIPPEERPGVVMGRLPQATQPPPRGGVSGAGAGLDRVASEPSARNTAQGTAQGTARETARETAQGMAVAPGGGRTAPGAYSPPVAERKVLRVGE